MKQKINVTALFIAAFPLVAYLTAHFVFNYAPAGIKSYVVGFISLTIGAGAVKWWQTFRPFLFAEKFEIKNEKNRSKS